MWQVAFVMNVSRETRNVCVSRNAHLSGRYGDEKTVTGSVPSRYASRRIGGSSCRRETIDIVKVRKNCSQLITSNGWDVQHDSESRRFCECKN